LIALNRQPDPVTTCAAGPMNNANKFIGLHQGFYDFLFRSSPSPSPSPRSKKKKNKIYQEVSDVKHNENKDKYTEILETIVSLFEENKGYKLYCTGHSLGGALATLFSFYVAAAVNSGKITAIPTPISCVSIASPRVGDQDFRDPFQTLEERGVLQHLRIVNDGDLIPVVPKNTGKYVWQSIDEKETYHHTGIKLKLYRTVSPNSPGRTRTAANANNSLNYDYKIQYSDSNGKSSPVIVNSKSSNSQSNSKNSISKSGRSNSQSKNKVISSLKREEVPYFVDHFGYTYCEIINKVKDGLTLMTLNGLYENKMLEATAALTATTSDGTP